MMERAEKRIEQAIAQGKIGEELHPEDEVEILSYPAAIMILTAIGNDTAKRRYALVESKRAFELLRLESPEKLLQIAAGTFGWNAKPVNELIGEGYYELAVYFSDYLRNAERIRDIYWKLTNRTLSQGYVYTTKDEFARLLEEEVQRRVFDRMQISQIVLSNELTERINRTRSIIASRSQAWASEEIPKAVISTAMPPCIRNLLFMLQTGKHIPHMGRFAMTSFLVNAGVPEEEVIKMLHALTDFDEKITRYQVEHIAGRRGSRTKYTPPNCKTMQTHGICVNPDDICATIRHPLSYYRKRVRMLLRNKGRTRFSTAS